MSAQTPAAARCDNYRPCSLCTRANITCATTGRGTSVGDATGIATRSSDSLNELGQRSRKRRRVETSQTSSPRDANSRSATDVEPNGPSVVVVEEEVHLDRSAPRIEPFGSQPSRQKDSTNSSDGVVQAKDVPRASTKLPTAAYLLNPLPPEDVMVTFLEEYFSSVHWFSLVIYEPSFRQAFDSVRAGFARPSQRPFLLLLSVVLGLGAWYRGQRFEPSGGPSTSQSKTWSEQMMSNAESRIIEILDQSSITAVQTLILLGSFFVYHGRPNLSFSLLGATVKSAQAAGLHEKSASTSQAEIEERKRAWWTIYTWDRFASITYGRPISIDESDCNVAMPGDVYESVDFQDAGTANRVSVCFSTYQRELNKLYMIASPAIKQVYSAREAVGPAQARAYVSLLEKVTEQLWQWRQALPTHLSLDLSQDCSTALDPGAKAHCLQSLSLHLTFDSLLIILHRPFLKRHLSALQRHGLGADHGFGVSGLGASEVQADAPYSRSSSEGAFLPPIDSSEQQWWNAAARTAKVVELPQLAQFASEGHLVAFLAINLFNAAIVMVVLALSDPLSDRAQEAKRAIARIHRLQSRLGAHSTLSKRSLVILRNLVVLLSQRESDAILAPMGESSLSATGTMSVRDTLAMPIGGSSDVAPANGLPQSNTADTQYASRLDDSLASVQRAFTVNSSTNFTYDIPGQAERTEFTAQSDPLPNQGALYDMRELAQYESDVATVSDGWSTGPADANNGLYWFWDAGWDELYGDSFAAP